MQETTTITKQKIIAMLTRAPHGALAEYIEVGRPAAALEGEFLAHLIAWNHDHGQVRDSRVALPVLSLVGSAPVGAGVACRENALAHLALLDPRNLVRAVRFAHDLRDAGGERCPSRVAINKLVTRYLREREQRWPWWERTAIQHRRAMTTLYALSRTPPSPLAQAVLYRRSYSRQEAARKGLPLPAPKPPYPAGSLFEAVEQLATLPAAEAAMTIVERRIPFLIAKDALGGRMREPVLLMALIERMSPTELVTHTAAFERLGMKEAPELRAAFEAALARAEKPTRRGGGLKASRAAAAQTDPEMRAKLGALQERQLDAAAGVSGDWAVLADKSSSMAQAIEVARLVSAVLARMVKGRVHLVFFDSVPRAFDVTGHTLEDIRALTSAVSAHGATSIGCGLQLLIDRDLAVQGIAIVSDAQENTAPLFAKIYPKFTAAAGVEPAVYLYRLEPGMRGGSDVDLATAMQTAGIDMQEFDLRGARVDYTSVQNLVATMRTARYALIEEIMATPLRTLEMVFKPAADLAA